MIATESKMLDLLIHMIEYSSDNKLLLSKNSYPFVPPVDKEL